MKAVLTRDGTVLIEQVEPAGRLVDRMRGLLGRPSLGPGKALYLSPCNSIHTFFMQFSLDLVFLDKTFTVTRRADYVGPHRIVWGGTRAASVLEMESGWLKTGVLQVGDVIEFR